MVAFEVAENLIDGCLTPECRPWAHDISCLSSNEKLAFGYGVWEWGASSRKPARSVIFIEPEKLRASLSV